MSNPTTLVMQDIQIIGGVQILNYDGVPPSVTYSYILSEDDKVITTEDNQNGFVTE